MYKYISGNKGRRSPFSFLHGGSKTWNHLQHYVHVDGQQRHSCVIGNNVSWILAIGFNCAFDDKIPTHNFQRKGGLRVFD